ncbi:MAG: DUF1553 domain-containing protein [Verrucomicrobia bacterium]|nr:DUF1553 domain-containing protein [Verrucomicrobiota bacterium]
MIRSLRILAACCLSAEAGLSAEVPASAGLEFFEKKIRPVLAEHCYECHSHQSKKLKAGLYLDSRAGVLQGGDTGVAVVLGEPDKSRLIEAIRHTNSDLQMPPKSKLPDRVIADFGEWIKIGAPWPEESAPKSAETTNSEDVEKRKREHWAWQPLRPVTPPTVTNPQLTQNAVDQFVLAKLEEKGMSPAPSADRRALIRRAYFDLIGLPPTTEEIEAFVQDKSSGSFARVVDRLLASPHYGERFARHWLDVARYGEDQAHSFQPRMYPQGFRYRDWLVRAFNDDLPYDRFVMAQIAGDLLGEDNPGERLPALGFFALGPVYYGDRKMFDQLDDRIDTLTRGFLGLTVACARCHDHKFDPISTKDYYGLAGVFSSSEYVEEPLAPKVVVEAYDKAQAAIQSGTKEIDKLLDDEAARITKSLPAEISRYMLAAWKVQNQRANDPKKPVEPIAKAEGLQTPILDRWVKYLAPQTNAAKVHLARWNELFGKENKDLSADEAAAGEARKVAEGFQKYVLSIAKLRDALDETHNAAVAVAGEKEKDKVVRPVLEKAQAAIFDEILGKDGLMSVTRNQVERLLPENSKSQLAKLRSDLDRTKKNAPPKYPFAHTLKEGSKIANIPVLIRGNQDAPGEEAPRRFLALLCNGETSAFTKGSGRYELACAIADKKNPLTPRVMVNRIWQHHFGHGLVRTPSNFGLLGEPPTHPELLDYLADQFIQSGWSIKSMHRLMMLSATYQRSTKVDARNHETDPENKLLWRMNRRRLEVEVWRDAMLCVAGSLDRAVGGPSVGLNSPANQRRTFYGSVSRHDLDSLLRLFDFPDPNVTSDQRTVTTVPLQQLFVLNSEFMIRQAKALANRLVNASDEPAETRVRKAFMLVYGRPPSEAETKLALDFLEGSPKQSEKAEQSASGSELSKWEQYAQVLLSANEFMYVD